MYRPRYLIALWALPKFSTSTFQSIFQQTLMIVCSAIACCLSSVSSRFLNRLAKTSPHTSHCFFAIMRVPSGASPPAGTMKWICGWRVRFCWQGECDHVVWQWQRLFEALLNPCSCVRCATDGTVAVIATVIKEVVLLAPGAVALVPAHGLGTALKDGLQGFALFEAQAITVARKKRFMESLNQVRYGVITLPCRFSTGAGMHVLSRTLCQFINNFQ